MKPFYSLSLFERAQYASYETLSIRALDYKLAAQRSVAEAELFEKMLTYSTQLPGFETLEGRVRSVLLAPLVRYHAAVLNQAQFSLFNEQELRAKIVELYNNFELLREE